MPSPVDWQVNWPVVDHPRVRWIRPRSTREDVADHFRVFAEDTVPGEGSVAPSGLLIGGDQAVLTAVSSQVVRSTGTRFTMRFALHLTVSGGLVARHHMYEDSQAVLAAFG